MKASANTRHEISLKHVMFLGASPHLVIFLSYVLTSNQLLGVSSEHLWMDEVHFAPRNDAMVETMVSRFIPGLLRWFRILGGRLKVIRKETII